MSGRISTRRTSQLPSIFESALSLAGITLKNDQTSHLINQEQSLVIRDLDKFLTGHENYPRCVESFVKEWKTRCEDKEFYINSLQHTYLCKNQLEESSIQQESLFHIFLNVTCLQESVMNMLLEQLIQYCCEDEDVEYGDIVLIIKSLRFLPFIKNEVSLTSKLVDAIEVAPLKVKIEILNYVSDIILDNQYDEMAKQLAKMLEEHESIAGAIIDCLNSFNLSPDARSNIQEYIIDRLLTSMRYYKIFPILFEFLISNTASENLNQVYLKTRATLNNIMCEESDDAETISNKVIIFKKLEGLVWTKRFLFDGLSGMINSFKNSSEHKPVDLLLLFLLHSCYNQKKKIIEGIFKRKIKSGFFKIALFERLFKEFFVNEIYSNFFDSMLEVGSVVLQAGYIDVGSFVIKELFLHKFSTHWHRQDVLFRLNFLMRFNDKGNFSVALGIIKDLLQEPSLKGHIIQLMGLLEKIHGLSLKDIKDLFDILCFLTCKFDSDTAHSGFKDEIHNTVLKQLSGSQKEITKCGIVSAVAMAKYLTEAPEEQSENSEMSINEISQIQTDFAKEAANILLVANKAASNMDLLGLYYDELSTMITSSEYMEITFLAWLTQIITDDFENIFIKVSEPEVINGIELSAQYCLNSEDEIDNVINVNIGELVINNNKTISILSPLFRLLRILHYKRNNGDLSSINALLGVPIILPKFTTTDDFSSQQLKQVADCIFHCINWFRETISAFVKSPIKQFRHKVIQRLRHLIDLQDILNTCMSQIPEHALPSSYFDTSHSAKISPLKANAKFAKRFKPNPITNETISATAEPKTSKRGGTKISINYKFRDIDTDLIILLKYPLKLDDCSTQSVSLHMKQFEFLMKDMINKLNTVTKNKNLGLSPLTMIKAEDMINDLSTFLPNVNVQSNVITDRIKHLLKEHDDRNDLPEIHTANANTLKLTFHYILEIHVLIFTWDGFKHSKNQSLLETCLKSFHNDTTTKTLNRLVTECINWLQVKIDQCLYLPTAVNMVKIMQALYELYPVPSINKLIVTSSEKLLQKKWLNLSGNQETGKIAFESIETLVKAYLNEADLATICGLVGTLQDEVENLKRKDDSLLMLKSIDKANLHVFYRELCTCLMEKTKRDMSGLTNNEHLTLWRTTTLTMQGLMSIVKIQKTRTNLRSFMKKSIGILKIFLTHGIPILEIMLRSKPNEVLEIFKIMQTSTRFIHHLCCYTKVIQDSGLMSLVPQFRLTLETLVYRVKAALVANNCSQAFWMGPLRNRDLDGEDILSQSSVNNTEEEDELSSGKSDDEESESTESSKEVLSKSGSETFEMEATV